LAGWAEEQALDSGLSVCRMGLQVFCDEQNQAYDPREKKNE
jgi:hypothetical protein